MNDAVYAQLLYNFCDFIVEFYPNMVGELDIRELCYQTGAVGDRYAALDNYDNYILNNDELAMFKTYEEALVFLNECTFNGILAHIDEIHTYIIRNVEGIRTYTLFDEM